MKRHLTSDDKPYSLMFGRSSKTIRRDMSPQVAAEATQCYNTTQSQSNTWITSLPMVDSQPYDRQMGMVTGQRVVRGHFTLNDIPVISRDELPHPSRLGNKRRRSRDKQQFGLDYVTNHISQLRKKHKERSVIPEGASTTRKPTTKLEPPPVLQSFSSQNMLLPSQTRYYPNNSFDQSSLNSMIPKPIDIPNSHQQQEFTLDPQLSETFDNDDWPLQFIIRSTDGDFRNQASPPRHYEE